MPLISADRKNAAKALLGDRALLAGVFRQLAGVGGPQVCTIDRQGGGCCPSCGSGGNAERLHATLTFHAFGACVFSPMLCCNYSCAISSLCMAAPARNACHACQLYCRPSASKSDERATCLCVLMACLNICFRRGYPCAR